MRTRFSSLMTILVVLLLASGSAWAQGQSPPQDQGMQGVSSSGKVTVAVIGTDVSGEESRYQRYEDLRSGPDAGFVLDFDASNWLLSVSSGSVGRRDQQYAVELEQQGKFSAGFSWSEMPINYSQRARSLYSETSPGVLTIDFPTREAIESGELSIEGAMAQVGPRDILTARDQLNFNTQYFLTDNFVANADVTSIHKTGQQPYNASFAFGQMLEIPLPLDYRTTTANVNAEWANDKGLFRLAYVGSWFDNNRQTIVWDNPFKTEDSTNSRAYVSNDGTSRGRLPEWPSNTYHNVTATGSVRLPARSRFTATVGGGLAQQDEALLPFTINSAIEPLPLDRLSADAKVRTLLANLQLTSRPNQYVNFKVRYRYNDLDNQTPSFDGEEYVRFDQVLEEGGEESHYHSIRRQDFDATLGFMPVSMSSLKIGYKYKKGTRTGRIFPETAENTVWVGIDSVGNAYFSLHGKYEHARRTGSNFDDEELEEVGEQPGMRHFDIANRTRDQFTGMFTVTPVPIVGVNFSVAVGNDDFDDSEFGLLDNKHRIYTVGFDAVPRDDVGFGAYYSRENYTSLQQSRNASPGAQFLDPNRNWTVGGDDTVDTFGINLDADKINGRFDLGFSWNYSSADSLYSFLVGSALPASVPLPTIVNKLQHGTVSGDYWVTPDVSVGFLYWYDKYETQDLANDGGIGITPPSGLLMGYFYQPYTANTFWLRLTYIFP